MKIEHLTFSGPLTIVVPDELTRGELELFYPFQQDLCQKMEVTLPNLEFKISLTVSPFGASFIFFRGEIDKSTYFPFCECICCFEPLHTEEMVKHMVSSINRVNFFNPGIGHRIIHPLHNFWISTAIFHWATAQEVKKAREITPYIFHSIALAKGIVPVSYSDTNTREL